jgi:DNA repair photolyase
LDNRVTPAFSHPCRIEHLFDKLSVVAARELRWQLAHDDRETAQQALFDVPEREIGAGEFRGLEFLHVRARTIINKVGPKSPVPFQYTINAYRGCSHACTYCSVGETPILMADGRTKSIRDVRAGDRVYGTEQRPGRNRRYVITDVLDHWSTIKPAHRVTLEDGTELVTSGDHRFLTDRGWKHVTGAARGPLCRPHLTVNNNLAGTGQFSLPPDEDAEYRAGYLSGMIGGDGHLGHYSYPPRPGRSRDDVHRFRLALVDLEALRRTSGYLAQCGITTTEFGFHEAVGEQKAMRAIRTSARAAVNAIEEIVRWPWSPSDQWQKGFLAGIFDAEGGYTSGILRIFNTDQAIIDQITTCLRRFSFRFAVDSPARGNPVISVRIVGGLRERLRFFHTVDPAITRKRTIEGMALKGRARLGVISIELLNDEMPMYDITTGTGDFIANGVVSHNCFARPTHEYLNLDPATDFDRVIVVKVNAVEKLRAELAPSRWRGEHIAMGTNTDPYQRAEGKYRLTQGIIEVLGEAGNPFSILTKGTLVLRDLDRLVEAARRTRVELCFSIGTLDEDVWRATEPGTPHPRKRIEAVGRINEAGIPCGVLVAPILPGLSDGPEQLDDVVRACVDAGAPSISPVLLHLRPGVKEHYLGWLADSHPELLERHQQLYPGSYAPARERDRITQLVRDLVTHHRIAGGTTAAPRPSSRFDPA